DPVAYLVVENGCNYFSPIAFPDTVHCGLRATHVGTSSMRFEVGLFRNDERVAAAQGWFVQVCCDRATQRPIPMRARVREALDSCGRDLAFVSAGQPREDIRSWGLRIYRPGREREFVGHADYHGTWLEFSL
ncbi:MAG: acyl-CoA thioester hydrolase, partial [Gaiellaceae bacterium]|nr:acyl-CoA thioester hydrolase [Gaiellaceae bacterium]